ncbi:efflux RND transporter periplasmic adaptor subunit [Sphingobacterium daejeonense]|jgi:RND family efflux transporter MFP subunit|uniref:efflux RND transporter periplasmic adaptor subunit n=1 Tax=Sphingobacterium daejeonense TaxID=371142 RepID=UPI0021A791E1|nr:efflux RND transporter periplasmic adaptor subunit [Sphingobacterium daejeonense]MCT1532989.1 efflux RND transporter periplasmic adaptor subunit [Sphingobacterium daejeonense]
MKLGLITLLLAGSAISLVGCQQSERKTDLAIQDTIPVKLMPIDQGSGGTQIEATGVFTTDDETLLSFKNGGVISRITVKEGDAVRKGQVLASVLSSEVDAKAGQARLAVEKARRDYERANKLYRDSVATLEQMQNAKTALDVAQQDLKSVSFNQQYSNIISPVSGYVLAKLANEGQVVGPGTPVLQVNGAGNAKWMLKVGVGDQQWTQIKVGDRAKISTDAMPTDTLEAVVSKKSEGLDPQSGTFAIFLELKQKPSFKLASGIFGKSIIIPTTTRSGNFWRIPFSSLLDGNGREGYVFITEDGKTAKKQKVKVASIENDDVLVESGLENAQSLIISGSPYLVDGAPIVIKK